MKDSTSKKKPYKAPKLKDFVSNGVDNNVKAIYESSILTANEDVPKPEPVFGVADPHHGNVFVGTKGNISLFKGSKKARKTFAISAVAAAVVGNTEIIRFKSLLGRKGLVLYVDTEQGRYDCKNVLHRELKMTGLDVNDFSSHLVFLTLRPHAPSIRKEVIKYAIEKLNSKLDLVIIDGIRDLMVDINDTSESTEIVTSLMAWSHDHNIHIINILHENKSNQNARGHIGSELDNKSESIIRIVKAENDENYSAIEAENMRGLSFDPYLFTIDDNAMPVLADEDVNVEDAIGKGKIDKKETKKGPKSMDFHEIDLATHAEIIKVCFMDEQGMFDNVDPLSARAFYAKLKSEFAVRKHKVGEHKIREFTEKYLDKGLLKDLNEDNEGNIAKKLVPGIDEKLPF